MQAPIGLKVTHCCRTQSQDAAAHWRRLATYSITSSARRSIDCDQASLEDAADAGLVGGICDIHTPFHGSEC
jgi:hypothetical protein